MNFFLENNGLDYLELISQGEHEIIRVFDRASQEKRVLKKIHKQPATPTQIKRLKNEFKICSRHSFKHVLPSLKLLEQGTEWGLLFENLEAIPLSKKLNTRIEIILDWAIQITHALGEIHDLGIIHKDIKPSNISLSNEGKIFITDFGYASEYLTEFKAIDLPQNIEGTLRYISPEQTGRMNRSIDYRSDYYSFGITLYELLTSQTPFQSEDPMELVYQQMTAKPKPPQEIISHIPDSLAEIILKLLAKTPESRYQNAQTLLSDLRSVKDSVIDTKRLSPTSLTNRFLDRSNRLVISQKLYGRDRESKLLIRDFENAAEKGVQFTWIKGRSGVGKTSLVSEVYKPLTRANGYFLNGKFDQFKKSIPYSGIRDALQNHLSKLNEEGEVSTLFWKTRISRALGTNAKVLVDIIPQLHFWFEEIPPVPELSASEAQIRFENLFVRLLCALIDTNRPILFFLDDLQWADGNSLRLIEKIASDKTINHLHLVLAYRDNLVNLIHPIQILVDKIAQTTANQTIFHLDSLQMQDIVDFVSDTFILPKYQIIPISDYLYKKAEGNPFYTIEILKTLHEEKVIWLESDTLEWKWDSLKIQNFSPSENVVEILSSKLLKMPTNDLKVLSYAACLGNKFGTSLIPKITDFDQQTVDESLERLLHNELLTPSIDFFKTSEKGEAYYRFRHDRIQQAAYELISLEDRETIHYRCGQILSAQYSENISNFENLLEIADHYNFAINRVQKPEEIEFLAHLNFKAAVRSREATVYPSALEYIKFTRLLIHSWSWNEKEQFLREFLLESSQIEFLNGLKAEAEKSLREAIDHTPDPIQKSFILHHLIIQYTLQARYEEAIGVARSGLSELGVEIPDQDFETKRDLLVDQLFILLGNNPTKMLRSLRPMTDEKSQSVMRLLVVLGPPCYRYHQKLWAVVVSLQLKTCIEAGSHPGLAYTYPAWCGLKNYLGRSRGFESDYLSLTIETMEHFNQPMNSSMGYLMIGSSLRHWFDPFADASKDYMQAYQIGLSNSNLQYAVYAFTHNSYCRFFQGVPLHHLEPELQGYLELATQRSNQWGIDLIQGILLQINEGCNERKESAELPLLDHEIAEKQYLQGVQSHRNNQVECIYHILRATIHLFRNEKAKALFSSNEAENYIETVATQGLLPWIFHRFNRILILDMNEALSEEEFQSSQNWFKLLSQRSSSNFIWISLFFKSLQEKRKSNFWGAIQYLDEAAELTNRSNVLHYQAFAHQQMGDLWNKLGKEKFSKESYHQAKVLYELWGLKSWIPAFYQSQVNPLGQNLSKTESYPTTTLMIYSLDRLVKASRELWTETDPDQIALIFTKHASFLMDAQRVCLMLERSQEFQMTAEWNVSDHHVSPIDSSSNLYSALLVQYATKTGQVSYWNRNNNEAYYSNDPYFKVTPVSSAVCIPIIQQSIVIGVVYAEHMSITDIFHPSKIRLVETLSSQCVIALENNHLLKSLEKQIEISLKRQEELRVSLESAMQANKAKSSFLAVMSHEIRTPLNGVIGFSSILEQSNLTEEQREYAQLIHSSGHSLLHIVNEILEFSKIEAGGMEIQKEKIELISFINQISENFVERAKSKSIDFLKEIGSGLPEYIHSDPHRLQQILNNLIGNAIKFTKTGSVTIAITVLEDNTHPTLRISVIDTGIGISEEGKKRIFQPFSQEDSSITRKFGGTGLGLAITKRIGELLGCAVDFESEKGKGSCFYIDLPLYNFLPEEIPSPQTLKNEQEKRSFEGLKVLFVEDNPLNQRLNEAIMKNFEGDVSYVSSALEAIKLCARTSFDVIFMDIQMPELNGYQTTKKIREQSNSNSKPWIIGLSANAFKEDILKCYEAGMNAFLAKPLQPQDLFDALKKYSNNSIAQISSL